MRRRVRKPAILIGLSLAFLSTGVAAQGGDATFRLSSGINYTSGDYGGTVDIEDIYVPITGTVDYGRFQYRLTVPYISVRAPAGTIITEPGGQPVAGSGARSTESGLGDVIGSVTLYDVVYNRDMGVALDITGKVKFATADELKGLGTGEHDYSVQADIYKYLDSFTVLASAGYTMRGDPVGIDLENVLFGSIGGIYDISPDSRGGIFFDFRQSSIVGADSIRELSGFLSKRVSEDWKIQIYALTGFSNSSPDFGGGVAMKRAF